MRRAERRTDVQGQVVEGLCNCSPARFALRRVDVSMPQSTSRRIRAPILHDILKIESSRREFEPEALAQRQALGTVLDRLEVCSL